MSSGTTDYDGLPMNCERVTSEELAEKYLLNRLADADREAFELHYFECRRCFEELDLYRTLLAQLPSGVAAPRTEAIAVRWHWAWAAPVALALLLAVVIVWQRRAGPAAVPSPPAVVTRPPSAPAPQGSVTLPSFPGPRLADLARLEPPPFAEVPLRSLGDAATDRLREAMKHYRTGNYLRAIAGLREARRLSPQAPEISFYLGISHLLAGQTDAGIAVLRQTVALGDSPYLEGAHFYLAKAALGKGDLDGARKELQRTVRMGGELEAESRELLGQVERLDQQRRTP